ncbi:hypothetical protein HPB51_023481 [Rhipicephalus microplus]|uniref:Uncharacterized protein n=1 Tax=Rhipicephalus microplus TaxID=6941 RepID=A0A9J6F8J7_RHIMP|nr:hypothetical protein HPB51_023481 [Rhipicephalus microplus]
MAHQARAIIRYWARVGAVIIFTGLLSVAFLGRRLRSYEWIGILGVMCGLVVVGLSDILFPDSHATKGPNSIITGRYPRSGWLSATTFLGSTSES